MSMYNAICNIIGLHQKQFHLKANVFFNNNYLTNYTFQLLENNISNSKKMQIDNPPNYSTLETAKNRSKNKDDETV